MKKNESDPVKEKSTATQDAPKPDQDLDLDEDLADALGEKTNINLTDPNLDLDQALLQADPSFKEEMDKIKATDFTGVVISSENQSEEVGEQEKLPPIVKIYWQNLSADKKIRYKAALIVLGTLLPISLLIYNGYLLPQFQFPYIMSMNELTEVVYSYGDDDIEVPLFDDFRGKAFTYALPKTTINLKADADKPSFGEFEFFINLREKELVDKIKARESEIIDIVQRTLEQITWGELQTPMGKERVKKVVRQRLNEHFDGNYVLGVYYRSIILQK